MYTMLLIHIFNRTDSKFARKRKKKKKSGTRKKFVPLVSTTAAGTAST